MAILVITTGGTIGARAYPDPVNPPPDAQPPEDGRDLAREELLRSFSDVALRFVSMTWRDSKDVNDDYRQTMLTVIASAPEDKILVTHGTDAILKTADFFDRESRSNPAMTRRIMVLTGSMVPLANGAVSEGPRNLAFAVDCLEKGAPGMAKINIVLTDYGSVRIWGTPQLYPYRPKAYKKMYSDDGRYHYLRKLTASDSTPT